MLSIRYHLVTTISLFLSLGLGMLIGGSMGHPWLLQTEHHIVHKMFQKYEEQLLINRQLSDQLNYWQTLQKETFPLLSEKNVLYLSAATGAHAMLEHSSQLPNVDLIIIDGGHVKGDQSYPIPIIDLKEVQEAMKTPQQMAQFVFYLKALIEGEANEPSSVYHHTSVE